MLPNEESVNEIARILYLMHGCLSRVVKLNYDTRNYKKNEAFTNITNTEIKRLRKKLLALTKDIHWIELMFREHFEIKSINNEVVVFSYDSQEELPEQTTDEAEIEQEEEEEEDDIFFVPGTGDEREEEEDSGVETDFEYE